MNRVPRLISYLYYPWVAISLTNYQWSNNFAPKSPFKFSNTTTGTVCPDEWLK